MKSLCTILLVGLATMAYAQLQATEQLNDQPATQQQPNAPSQTPQQANPPSPSPQQTKAQSPIPAQASAQAPQQVASSFFHRFELSGGYAHISGNEGLNGFNAGASFFLARNISLGFNFDGVWDTTILGSGAFAFTNLGLVTTKSHMYDYLAGPRIYFPGVLKPHCGATNVLPVLRPFV